MKVILSKVIDKK